jgi:hypothetical protein
LRLEGQLRRLHGISITITSRERLGELYVVTARARDKTGREDESIGAVAVGSLKGDALANALMKAETKAKRRVTLSLAGLGWLDETELETIPGVRTGEAATDPDPALTTPVTPADGNGQVPPEARISRDQARELKKAAQAAFGFAAGEQQLREDLGLEAGKPLTLLRLQAHVSPTRYGTLLADYQAALWQEMEADVPDFPPPAATGEPAGPYIGGPEPGSTVAPVPTHGPPRPELTAEARMRWGSLSRRSMKAGLLPSVWEVLRQGDYAEAERVIVALEGQSQRWAPRRTAPGGVSCVRSRSGSAMCRSGSSTSSAANGWSDGSPPHRGNLRGEFHVEEEAGPPHRLVIGSDKKQGSQV